MAGFTLLIEEILELTIDIGNTRTKMALFQTGQVKGWWNIATLDLEEELERWAKEILISEPLQIGWMSVGRVRDIETLPVWANLGVNVVFIPISTRMELPVINRYQTPETLGIDRIVAVIGARSVAPDHGVLVIDAGTAITYDFADNAGEYLGGGISPGMNMRFRALHEFTAGLPLVKPAEKINLVGRSTVKSIQSGVINGLFEEIEGVIRRYRATFGQEINVFLTGGDMHYFENHLKNINFADAYLTHKGIYHILTYKPSL